MSYDKTIYKVIPFAEVAIGQEFEDARAYDFVSSYPWVKLTEGHHELKGNPIEGANSGGGAYFDEGCLVRLSVCKPQDPLKAEPVKTLRDEMAIAVMSVLLVHPQLKESSENDIANLAYEQADAMLKAREGNSDE